MSQPVADAFYRLTIAHTVALIMFDVIRESVTYDLWG